MNMQHVAPESTLHYFTKVLITFDFSNLNVLNKKFESSIVVLPLIIHFETPSAFPFCIFQDNAWPHFVLYSQNMCGGSVLCFVLPCVLCCVVFRMF